MLSVLFEMQQVLTLHIGLDYINLKFVLNNGLKKKLWKTLAKQIQH